MEERDGEGSMDDAESNATLECQDIQTHENIVAMDHALLHSGGVERKGKKERKRKRRAGSYKTASVTSSRPSPGWRGGWYYRNYRTDSTGVFSLLASLLKVTGFIELHRSVFFCFSRSWIEVQL